MSPREEDCSSMQLIKSESMVSLDHSHNKENRTRKVEFGSVHIRDYNRVVGDHPDVKVGPPVSIGWEYSKREPISLDEYEETRPKRKAYLRMSSVTRKNMLLSVFGIPEEEIASAEKEVQKIRRQREHSNKQGKAGAKMESGMLSFRRKLRRRLSAENLFKGMAGGSNMFPIGMHA